MIQDIHSEREIHGRTSDVLLHMTKWPKNRDKENIEHPRM